MNHSPEHASSPEQGHEVEQLGRRVLAAIINESARREMLGNNLRQLRHLGVLALSGTTDRDMQHRSGETEVAGIWGVPENRSTGDTPENSDNLYASVSRGVVKVGIHSKAVVNGKLEIARTYLEATAHGGLSLRQTAGLMNQPVGAPLTPDSPNWAFYSGNLLGRIDEQIKLHDIHLPENGFQLSDQSTDDRRR